MANREIIVSDVVGLVQEEDGDFVLTKPGAHPYKMNQDTRTYHAIRILDLRCQIQQKKYLYANSLISNLEEQLHKIESSRIYKFFHALGLI